jgi:DNA-directed RNA polymerase specialized sigma24 family protein
MLGALKDFEDRGRGSLQAALLTVLDCTLVDLGRRAKARKRGGDAARVSIDESADGAVLASSLASADTTPTSRARERDLAEIARRVLEPRELEVWTLVARCGLDSTEAARQLRTTDSAVRGLLKRARAKLIRALDRERPGDDSRSGS